MSDVWSLEGYDVQVLLGFGASGEVWRAVHVDSGDVVALKRLRGAAAGEPSAQAALRREADLLRRLDSPHVVRLREVVGAGASTVLVLDHAGGGSLAALLASRRCLPPGAAVSIGVPLAQGLAAAHARGLVHGDVSPANVLFTDDGRPLLSDLGVARAVGEPLPVDGTAEYVDPAVAAGGEPGPTSDVWALAAVLHHVLAGCPPHEGQSAGAVLDEARSGGRAPLGLLAPTVPRSVVEAVEAGLHPEPEQRPSAAAFAGLLRRAHLAVPVQLEGDRPARSERPTHRVERPADPHANGAGDGEGRRGLPSGARARAALRQGPAPRVLAALGVVLLLLSAAGLGWASARHGSDGTVLLPVASEPVGSATSGRSARPGPATSAVRRSGPAVAPRTAPVDPPKPVRSTSPSPRPSPGRPDWRAVLDRLDAARAAAFGSADVRVLAGTYVDGSPARTADAAAVLRLAADGWHAVGVRHRLLAVQVLHSGPGRARLRVTDELPAARVVDAAGELVAAAPPRPAASHLVEVRETRAGWRLASVSGPGP